MTDLGALLDFAAELGFEIQMAGGEIYRVEETVKRLLAAYGVESGEVFAIPNCLIVSATDGDREALTRVRRVPDHGTDIYRLEAVNDLCRRLCRDPKPLREAQEDLKALLAAEPSYPFPVRLLAYFVGAALFTLFFGGTWRDGLCAGVCGSAIGLTLWFMTRMGANLFFRTITGGAVSALLALLLARTGLGESVDLITIGALMSLVPGVALTSAIRDIMVGDMVSGISKLSEAVLIAIAIALGTGLAMWLTQWLVGVGL